MQTFWYIDADHDGWGTGPPRLACPATGSSEVAGDCDDTNPAMHPGQFKCVAGGQGNEYLLCEQDGGFRAGVCGQCRPQPNGTGYWL